MSRPRTQVVRRNIVIENVCERGGQGQFTATQIHSEFIGSARAVRQIALFKQCDGVQLSRNPD